MNAIDEYKDERDYNTKQDSNNQEFDEDKDYDPNYEDDSKGENLQQSDMLKLECPRPSFHALLKMKGKVNGREALILHDDKSTHDFIYERFAQSLGLELLSSHYTVKAAFKNQKYNCTKEVHNVNLSIGSFVQARTFLVAPLQGIYMILGMPFRHEFNPRIDYTTLTITFDYEGNSICLQAMFKNEQQPLLTHTQAKRALRKKDKFLVMVN